VTDPVERAEAEQGLRSAVARYAEVIGCSDPDDLLDTFVVVASWLPPEANGKCRYVLLCPTETPAHTLLGLFSMGESIILGDDY